VATRTFLAVLAVLVGLSVASIGAAHAEPTPPPPAPTNTSTDDELVDMVLDAIQQGSPDPAIQAPEPAN
jgi:hypothetical protein